MKNIINRNIATNNLLSLTLILFIFCATGCNSVIVATNSPPSFNGEKALADVAYQVSLGPRIPGSTAHARTAKWIAKELESAGWKVEIQETQRNGQSITNVIGKRGEGNPWIILGAHYDTRIYADRDPNPDNRNQPVPGANDGGSGVAVLLELARILPGDLEKQDGRAKQVWMVFFDAEDNGDVYGAEWSIGSQAFVDTLKEKPDAAVIVDMVGDANLNILQEGYSNPALTQQIWEKAKELGYSSQFIQKPQSNIIDDHLPFLQAGIPAIDIIDLDYPYWHTVSDIVDNVSASSLKIVGDTIIAWLNSHN